MKILKIALSLCLLTSSLSLYSAPEGFLFNDPDAGKIVVNNRILAKVNGKPISVIDLMKKLDILFYRDFPEYTASSSARFQFYEANWRPILQELINKELVLADAEESKVEVSNGDVRQEMEHLFGPNIIANLDKVGMSFDDASKIVQGDILLRRMLGARVHAKAIRLVTPAQIRDAYEKYSSEKTNQREAEWHYQVISFRDQDPVKSEQAATAAYQLMTEKMATITDLKEKLISQNALSESTTFNISEEAKHKEPQMSEVNKPIIMALQKGSFSEPVSQKSRADKSTVFRIFVLNNKIEGGVIPFSEIENRIHDKLIDIAIDKETIEYLNRLKVHFHYHDKDATDMIPEDYHPFSIL